MATHDSDSAATLRRRLERERASRREAEVIAERVTGELYRSKGELERLNGELRRTNEELQSLNQALREFVAIASHDLRSPLTAMIGFASMLESRWDDIPAERRLDMLHTIVRQGGHLNQMVEDLLTVSSIEAGQLDTHAEVIRVRDALEVIAQEFGREVAELLVIPDDASILVDPHHLQRIMSNYVGNALKYGQPPVQVEARRVDEWIEIRVRDRGAGIPEEFVPRLFGKFARGEDSGAKGGTGLGLSIVRGLAQANGGDTWYEPNVPQGACFGVRLPVPV